MILDKISSPSDLKTLNEEELLLLANEIRETLLKSISHFGGHLGPNLGVIELTIALHYVFNSPIDKIIFDVSHQCYTHKILTGRKEAYLDDNRHHEVTGFTNPFESEHDLFEIGHTSTSLSLASGLIKGRDILKEKYNVIAVIGDGSLSGGEAYEGLNAISELGSNAIIIVNDNEMSIAENHGGYYKNLQKLRETNGNCKDNLFKALGFEYLYLEEGNSLVSLLKLFKEVKDIDHPIVLHIHTKKGCGYLAAEEDPESYHFVGPFVLDSGKELSPTRKEGFNDLVREYLEKEIAKGEKIVAINAATPKFVFGLDKAKREEFGEHFVDVGIAEEEAAAMASGLAKTGVRTIWGVSSSFMQRAYDQINQDIALNKTPVTILVANPGGLNYGGTTHTGMFDISLLSNIPNLTYLAPVTKEEFLKMLDYSTKQKEGPIAIRVPKEIISSNEVDRTDYSKVNKSKVIHLGKDIAILAVGNLFPLGEELSKALRKEGYDPTLINPVFLSGIDKELLEELKKDHKVLISLEDGCLEGGYGEKIARFLSESSIKVLTRAIPKGIYRNVNLKKMKEISRMDLPSLVNDILNLLK